MQQMLICLGPLQGQINFHLTGGVQIFHWCSTKDLARLCSSSITVVCYDFCLKNNRNCLSIKSTIILTYNAHSVFEFFLGSARKLWGRVCTPMYPNPNCPWSIVRCMEGGGPQISVLGNSRKTNHRTRSSDKMDFPYHNRT